MNLTANELRNQVQQTVDSYLGVPVEITPRAMAALHGRFRTKPVDGEKDGGFEIEAASVFEALLASSPSCLMALFASGVRVENLFTPHADIGPGYLTESTLKWIFNGPEDSFVKAFGSHSKKMRDANQILFQVARTRRLTEYNLFSASIGTAYVGPEKFDQLTTGSDLWASFSDIGQKILDAGFADAGLFTEGSDLDGNYWTESTAAARFRRLSEQVESFSIADPSHDLWQFALWLDVRGRMHVRPFGVGSCGRSKPEYLTDGQKFIYRDGVFQPAETVAPGLTDDAVGELEDMINSTSRKEADFQRFFQKHPQFLLGLDYRQLHPQLALFPDSDAPLIPDFFLEPLASEFCDILELKLPYTKLVRRLRQHKRVRFSAFVNEAIAQLEDYRRYFDELTHRKDFHQRYGLSAYRPRMILIVGRRHDFRSDVERAELRELIPKDLALWTYDDVLARAQAYRRAIRT